MANRLAQLSEGNMLRPGIGNYCWSLFCILAGLLLVPDHCMGANEIANRWPPRTLAEGLGVSVHFDGIVDKSGARNISEQEMLRYEQELDQIAETGIKIVRMDGVWRWTNQNKGEYEFVQHHRLVDACRKRGLRVSTILTFVDYRYETKFSVRTEPGRQSFSNFCARMAGEFKDKGVIWEVWNEPEGTWETDCVANRGFEFAKAAKAALQAMKKVDQNCVVMSTCGCDFDFHKVVFQNGILDNLSAVGLHPYGDTPEANALVYLQMHGLIDSYLVKPRKELLIVCSELGYSRVFEGAKKRVRSQEEQAALLVRSIVLNQMAGIPMHTIYMNRDRANDLVNNQNSFGLVTSDGKAKKAILAIKTLIHQVDGLPYERRLLAGSVDLFECSTDDYVALFSDGKRRVVVAWTSAPTHSAKIQLPGAPSAIYDMLGTALSLPRVEGMPLWYAPGKAIEVQLTTSPIYIHVPVEKP
jgi:hypothetical protein